MPDLSWDVAIALFLDHHRKIEPRLSPRTLSDYGRDFAQFAAFLATEDVRCLGAIDRDDVLGYFGHLATRGVSPRSRARYLSSIRMVFAFLVAESFLTKNPALAIARPAYRKKPPRVLDHDEVSKLLGAPDRNSPWGTRNAAMLALLYATKLRVSELLGLKVSSVDFSAWLLRVGRGGKARTILINDETYLVVRAYVDRARARILAGQPDPAWPGTAMLFVTRQGGAMTTRTFARILAASVRKAGIRQPLSSHSLRHSFAAHLVEHGVDLRVVQAMLGHAVITSTNVYKRMEAARRTDGVAQARQGPSLGPVAPHLAQKRLA